MKILILIIILTILLISNIAEALDDTTFCMIYFTAIGCPNCAVTDPIVLNEWPNKYDNLVIIEYMFEDWGDENAHLLGEYTQKYGTMGAVPQIFINEDKNFLGRLDVPKAEDEIKTLESNKCLIDGLVSFNNVNLNEIGGNPLKIWSNGKLLIRLEKDNKVSSDFLRELLFSNNLSETIEKSDYKIEKIKAEPALISNGKIEFTNAIKIEDSWTFEFNEEIEISHETDEGISETENITETNETNETEISDEMNENIVEIPFFGEVDITKMSLPVLTILLGAADGFNPCAFFILTFLLSMLINAGSRKKILFVGAIFVFFSGLIYFLFMCAWLNVFLLAEEITILTLIAGVIAVVTGVINVKDFFFFKKGISLTLPTKQRIKMPEKIEKLMKMDSLLSLGIGTALFAITVNLYELLCTVGFPILFIRALTLNEIPTIQYYFYLIFYNIIYVIPISIIVLIFAITLGSRKFGVEQVKMLKLISGLMILFLGLILIFEPHWLENILISIGVIVAAVLISGLIIFIKNILVKRTSKNCIG